MLRLHNSKFPLAHQVSPFGWCQVDILKGQKKMDQYNCRKHPHNPNHRKQCYRYPSRSRMLHFR